MRSHLRLNSSRLSYRTFVCEQPSLSGFMIPTWFLSMWISNSATAAMMVTIAQAVINQLQLSETQIVSTLDENTGHSAEHGKVEAGEFNDGISLDVISRNSGTVLTHAANHREFETPESLTDAQEKSVAADKWEEMGKGLLMCVAYSASIGGIATITGTAPNLIFNENLQR